MRVSFEELARDDVYDVSFMGSHSYMRFDGKNFGIPALGWRQFTDWHPRKMLFSPLFGAEGEIEEYLWRPDYVKMRGKIGTVPLEEKVAYIGEDLILLDMQFLGEGELAFNINPAQEAEWKLERGEDGIVFKVSADMSSLTGKKPHILEEEFVLICKGDFKIGDGKISVNAREGGRFLLAFGIKESAGLLEEALRNPEQAFERAGKIVEGWMDEIDGLEVDESRHKMLYWCWYQFFFNTERPKGLWKRPIICPSMSQYGRGVWLWDSAFHILGLIAGGEKARELAKSQVYVLVDNLIDGHLPREVWVDEPNPQLQAPGILSWASLEIYERAGEREFIEYIYPALAKNHEWFFENTDSNGNGLCEWEGADSGWDTSPRWDEGVVDAVDLNAWLYLDKLCLSRMAKLLGRQDEAESWAREAEKFGKFIAEKFWDEEDGWFYDLNLETGEFVRVGTPAALWMLFVGVATQEQAKRVVRNLLDEEKYWTRFPMPCVAADELKHQPNNYWRGPTWINLNWIGILGLEKYGFTDVAQELRRKTLELIERYPITYEYYNPHTGKGLGGKNYLWTASFYVANCAEK